MIEVMSQEGCKKLDRYTIDEIGIPSIVLMENAASEVVARIADLNDKFIVFCGTGNNGGDGLAIARKLLVKEKDVYVVIIGENKKCSEDFFVNINILKKLTNKFIYIKSIEDIKLLKKLLNK